MERRISTLIARAFSAVILLVGITALSGCDLFTANDTGPAQMNVKLTDAPFPFDMIDSTKVTIDRVELVTAEDSIITLYKDVSKTYDLLRLQNGVTADLASADVPAGTYSQVRLHVVDNATLVDTSGTSYTLFVPSGTETGIKINLDGMTLDPGTEGTLTLDFDLEDSFVLQGSLSSPADIKDQIIFKPVIHLKSADTSE